MSIVAQVYTTGELLAKLHELKEETKQVETCLKSLRGTAWRLDLEKDERPFVKELVDKHNRLEKEHSQLLNTKWEEVI